MDENRAVSGVEVVEKFGPITEDETELLLRCSPVHMVNYVEESAYLVL